jgi:hypothetical protein
MEEQWTKNRLEQMIQDGVEESLTLEYKAAGSLRKTDDKRKEMTKDVSAMANSAGGTIIYGIKECHGKDKQHLPEKIDPISRVDYPREWIEHVLSNIHPRIADLIIHPVPIDSDSRDVVYVLEIPKGDTAHQAQDLLYYRRYNFENVPMHDYEIRDVMGRSKYPIIEIEMFFVRSTGLLELQVSYYNTGPIYAQCMIGFLQISSVLFWPQSPTGSDLVTVEGVEYRELFFQNIHKDIIEVKPGSSAIPSRINYITRYDPILPGVGGTVRDIGFSTTQEAIKKHADSLIRWIVYADNSPKTEGQIPLGDIEIRD